MTNQHASNTLEEPGPTNSTGSRRHVAHDEPRQTVYVVIPTFNRKDRTISCLEQLAAQTYPYIKAIVSDGGSTDGTRELVAATFPDAALVAPEETMWWGGSTHLGIAFALEHGVDEDFIMLMNDDISFERDYVATIIRHSQESNCIVCGAVVDSETGAIIDSGVQLDWDRFAFSQHSSPVWENGIFVGSDVLPGRGTLYPLAAVREAGNIDHKRFPHYLSDYEFSYRVSSHSGMPLAVAADAKIFTQDSTGITVKHETGHPVTRAWRRLRVRWSKRSKQNIPASIYFITSHAPREQRFRTLATYLNSTLRHIASPLADWPKHSTSMRLLFRAGSLMKSIIRKVWRLAFGPYLVSRRDLLDSELDELSLHQHKILTPSRYPGYYAAGRNLRYARNNYPEALPLYQKASWPHVKLGRALLANARLAKTRLAGHFARSSRMTKLRQAAGRLWRTITAPVSLVARILFGPYLITRDDIEALGLDRVELAQHQVIKSSRYPNYFQPGRNRRYLKQRIPSALKLYRRSANPFRKLNRGLSVRYSALNQESRNRYREVIRGHARRVKRILIGPYLISRQDVTLLNLDILTLSRHQVIRPSIYTGYYAPGRETAYLREKLPEALPLYRRAANPIRKAVRYANANYRSRASRLLGSWRKRASMMKRQLHSLFANPIANTEDCHKLNIDIVSGVRNQTLEPLSPFGFYRLDPSGLEKQQRRRARTEFPMRKKTLRAKQLLIAEWASQQDEQNFANYQSLH